MNLQVYFPHHFNAGIKFLFSLQCPGEFINDVLKLQLFYSGTVRGNLHFYDLCKVVNRVKIAYINSTIQIDSATNTVILPPTHYPLPIKGWNAQISFDFEIIGEFLRYHNIIPTWIDCHYTFGWYDEESGKWTGEVGKVRIMYLYYSAFY